MNAIAHLSRQQLRQLWDQAAQRLGTLPPAMVEKDFWVCWTLRLFFALPGAPEHFIFKGGTSLSKVWRAIHRFSEDIDISLSREWLGFGGSRDPESATSGKKRRGLLEQLSAACSARLREEILPALRTSMASILGNATWSLEIAEEDPQTILFAYPAALTTAIPYIQPVVRIECGARADLWPMQQGQLAPFVADAFPETIPDARVCVPVLGIERTFWEKATILHAEAHRPENNPTPLRFARHYADLAALARHDTGRLALLADELRARVVDHKRVFFPSAWAHYQTAVPGTFRLIPPQQRLDALSSDYAAMRDMFFAPPMTWGELLDALAELEQRINHPMAYSSERSSF